MTEEEVAQENELRARKKANDLRQAELQDEFDAAIAKRDEEIAKIGNLVPDDVPVSKDEAFNGKVRHWAPEAGLRKNEDNKLKHHHELLYMIGGYEPERGAKVAGHRGYFLTGPGVILNMALQNYGVQFLLKRKYKPVYPPFFMRKSVMQKTAQLSEFDEALYHVNEKKSTTDTKKEEEKYVFFCFLFLFRFFVLFLFACVCLHRSFCIFDDLGTGSFVLINVCGL